MLSGGNVILEFLYRLDELVDVVLSREIDYFTL